jgi:ABC-type antimicrobial peptide transport system permease subunit
LLKNYFKIAFRNLIKKKGYSFINIAGLTLGITAFFLISVWVMFHLSFDRFHENASHIYRVMERRHFPDHVEYGFRTPGPLAASLEEKFSEVKEGIRVAMTGERVIKHDDKIYFENGILTVDPSFLRVFSFPFVLGDKETALNDLFSIVITESMTKKYFGAEDPMGKVLTLDDKFEFTVTGVVEDCPMNSHLWFDMLVPFEIVEKLGWSMDVWDYSMTISYLQLKENVDFQNFSTKIANYLMNFKEDTNIELMLQPLTRIHLYSDYENPDSRGLIQYIFVYSFVGILILFIACINFMNLATARSERRAKEIGMRKVIGAAKRHLIGQFLLEAVLIAFISLLFAPLLLEFFLPRFNEITGQSFTRDNFLSLKMILLTLCVTLLTGLISGIYPALFLSSFQPVKVLKGWVTLGTKGAFLRKTLVVIQLSVSVVLIIVSIFVFNQINFLKNKDLGFDKEHIVSIPLGISNADNPQIYQRFKDELSNDPRVLNITGSFTHPMRLGTPMQNIIYNGIRLDELSPLNVTSVDYDYIKTFKLPIIRGRSFSQEFGSERGNVIINESFEKLLGEDSALGKTLTDGESYRGKIVGVIKDFHIEPASNALIEPLALFCHPSVNFIFARILPDSIAETMVSLENAWKKSAPNIPFKYNFLDDDFERLYTDLENLGATIKYFTIVAAFIACLGILGLVSFSTEKRKKEIGIRKVLGSSSKKILTLLCRDYFKLALISNFIAWPAAWFFMKNWLMNFAYRVGLSLTVFVFSGFLSILITMITVGFQTIRASFADPVKSIRYE